MNIKEYNMTLGDELAWRGLVNQTTFDDISQINEPRTFYLGVDPSAPSMHIGNLVQIMMVRQLIRHGHKPIVLVGGATGMIGDPKLDTERSLKSLDEIAKNKEGIARQYKQLLDGEDFLLVDNYDWFKDIGYLDFLRDIGKNFSMTQLLDRDFVKSRIGRDGVGISYAEFSYSLIQGYDYLHLFRQFGATLQIGGSDQWGNMLSGAQMIRKLDGVEAHVWTVPIVTDQSTGKKFGKSEGNAVWLDPDMTSPYKFYQFWLNADDATSTSLIKIFTELPREQIESAIEDHQVNPGARLLQRTLAGEVTELVHGRAKRESIERVTAVLFGKNQLGDLEQSDIDQLAREIPTAQAGDLVGVLVESKLARGNGEARRLIESSAISVNGQKVTANLEVATLSLVKKGKNSFCLVV